MKQFELKHALFAIVSIAAVVTSSFTTGQTLSQEPLLTKTVSVRPNLTFILDDSGSMAWECIYTKNTQTSFGGIGYGAAYNCRNDTDEDFSDGNVATLSSSDFRYTSPENNKLMYDPRVYYPTGISERQGHPTQIATLHGITLEIEHFQLAAHLTKRERSMWPRMHRC